MKTLLKKIFRKFFNKTYRKLAEKRRIKRVVSEANKDAKSIGGTGVDIPRKLKKKYNALGFSNKEIVYYDLLHNDYHDYISHYERTKLEFINGRFADILGEKVMSERIWGNYINVPKTYSYIRDGKFLDLDGNAPEFDVIELLKKEKRLIAKPTRSMGGGHGVCALLYENGKLYINGAEYSEENFSKELRTYTDYIIVQWIDVNDFSKSVFPKTTNSIRIVTVMNRGTNKAEVILAYHRFGTEKSYPVDNCCSGGVWCNIDVDTGVMYYALTLEDPSARLENHPDTNVRLYGVTVPMWDELKRKFIHVHNCFPYYEFLAWDAVVDKNGYIYILEVNRGCDVHPTQVAIPLRRHAVGKYMREHGLLQDW